jgi:hypothetical protein
LFHVRCPSVDFFAAETRDVKLASAEASFTSDLGTQSVRRSWCTEGIGRLGSFGCAAEDEHAEGVGRTGVFLGTITTSENILTNGSTGRDSPARKVCRRATRI